MLVVGAYTFDAALAHGEQKRTTLTTCDLFIDPCGNHLLLSAKASGSEFLDDPAP